MIYRLRYCNKDGVEARVDIQKGSSTPVIDVEGTERPFILSYNNDKGNKSGMFLTSSADIEIYETPEFNIDNLKTSNETELSVTHYIDNVITWQGFIIPDFFSIEVRNNPVITMTASDRLGTLKNVTLSDLPSMISLRELAVLCLNKTGLTLPLRTMADFNNGTGINDFFNSKILTQRLSDTKGRSISCYDILSSILTASNSKLLQRGGEWVIINKVQHEAGSGKLFSSATSFINWSDVIFNFSDINVGGRRTIIPVAASTGVYHEHGGGRLHPDNYDFSKGLTGWTSVGGFVAAVDNKEIKGFTTTTSGAVYTPVYGNATEKSYLINENEYIRNVNPKYLESEEISIPYSGQGSIEVEVNVNALAAAVYATPVFILPVIRIAVVATNGSDVLTLDYSGKFVPMPSTNPPVHEQTFEKGEVKSVGDIIPFLTEGIRVKGTLEVSNLEQYKLKIRIYGTQRAVYFHSVDLLMRNTSEVPKGTIFKIEQGSNYTKEHEIDTSIWGDYMTGGLNGYFYKYPIDDTSSLYNSNNELTSKWTAYNDPEQLPLLQHITRQKSRLFSVAHDLLSAEIEVSDFDPLAIFVSCDKRYTVVSAQFDFFKSNLSVELEEVAFQNATVRDFIYSYFGDGESGIKSIGGISGGSGGGSTGGGLTPEQLEILSFWKKDPDRENTIFTEMNAYSKLELSAYGAGDGGGSGGSDYERLDTWADYDSSKAGWVLSAFLGNDLNTRVTAIDDRVTDLENTAGGGTVTSVGISVPTGLSVSNSPITSSGVIAIGLQTGYSIPTTVKQGQWDGVVTDFGNLEIGGRNFVSDSGNYSSETEDSLWVINSGWSISFENYYVRFEKTDSSSGQWIELPLARRLVVGEEYLFSIKCRRTNPRNTRLFLLDSSGGSSNHDSYSFSPSSNWEKIYFQFTAEKEVDKLFFTSSDFINDDDIFDIEYLKIEKGNKATDWTPAPEDQVSDWNTTDVNSFSFIKNKPTLLSQFTDNIGVATHISNTSNPHSVTKAQVGLGSVDNTSDLNKPISTATQTALNLKLDKSVFDDLFEKVEVSTGVFAIKAKYDFYSIGEASAYGLGSGGSGGGSYDRLDAWADYDSTKSGWVLSALLGNELNTRVGNLESGSATTVNTTGTGNAITSISKAGTVITANKDLTFSLSNHLHSASDITSGTFDIARIPTGTTGTTVALGNHLHTGVYEPVFTKNTAFNKNFGTTAGTVAQGNDSRINNGQTAYGWGNHSSAGYALNSSLSNYLPLTGGTLTGNLTAPSFIGALTGNAASATTATNLSRSILSGNGLTGGGVLNADRTLTLGTPSNIDAKTTNSVSASSHTHALTSSTVDFTSLADMSNTLNGMVSGGVGGPISGASVVGFWTTLASSNSYGGGFFTRYGRAFTLAKENGVIGEWQELAYLTSNVASATKLQTPRTIWGQSFDGSGNVTGALTGATTISASTSISTPRVSHGDTYIRHVQGSHTIISSESAGMIFLRPNGNANITNQATLNSSGVLSLPSLTASTSVTTPKVIFAAAGWSMEQVGSELQMKHNNVLKMRFTSTGSIVATEEITAFG